MYSPSPVTRKDRVANWLARTGLLRMAEYLPQRECLVVMNHHRIGDGAATPYDSGVFSATAEALDRQLRFLKKRFRCLTLEETIAFVEGRTRLRGAGVLLTFDDGYLDNFQAAFPCLRSHGVQAVFFLPTRFIGAEYMTWWDSVAYMVKNANRRKFSIAYPAPADFDVDAEGLDTVLLRLFRTYKAPEMQDGERFLAELREIANCGPLPRERMFLNWEEARQMLHGGMAIGSHTHGHELLAKLTPERQLEEMTRSKQIDRAESFRLMRLDRIPIRADHFVYREDGGTGRRGRVPHRVFLLRRGEPPGVDPSPECAPAGGVGRA